VAIPVAAVLTIWMMPVWALVERETGIESVGHSGPADWCYYVTYAVTVLVPVGALALRQSRRREKID
jgi:hypothetical protein